MAKLTKRMRVIREKVDVTKEYEINEAIALLKELATAKFVESVDVAVNLASMLVNLTRTYVVRLFFLTVLAVKSVLQCSPRVLTLKRLKKLVQTS
jgi:hypothetical protein